MKTMKDVIRNTTLTTPKTIKWEIADEPGARRFCPNTWAHAHRAANRKANR